jgi:anti-sigma regulatory factor (Ser/Thr protein kinase)
MIFPVHDEQLVRDERVVRVRLAADPASVPGARRFVADGLRAWGRDDLVDDATLCVSELAGNAALHGDSTFIQVSLLDLRRVVRVCVEDDGPAPASQVVARCVLPDGVADGDEADELDELERMLAAPTTGRGLAIVSVLASDWGVEELATGKRVWADLAAEADPAAASATPGTDARTPAPPADGPTPAPPVGAGADTLPEGWVVIRLAGCPVELSLRQDQHLDDLVRELTLMRSDRGNADSLALADRLEAVLRAPAHARAAGRRQAQAALERGEQHVDVDMAMPREFCSEVRLLHEAVCEADRLCEQQRLLTLTSPRELREFRAWMTEQILAQAEQDAAPTSWAAWRARRER